MIGYLFFKLLKSGRIVACYNDGFVFRASCLLVWSRYFKLTYVTLCRRLAWGGDVDEVEMQSGVGALPSRDLTGLLGLYVLTLGPVL